MDSGSVSRRSSRLIALRPCIAAALALGLVACTAKSPGAGGGGRGGDGMRGDDPEDGATEFDAAVADANPDELPPGCSAIGEDDESNTLTVAEGTGTEEARAFVPKYAFATWSTFEECTRGSVVIGLGANSCSPTSGPTPRSSRCGAGSSRAGW